MKIPKIGITANITLDNDEGWEGYRRCSVSDFCAQSIADAGGVPFVMPVIKNESLIKEQVASLDGILLSGGQDVNPQLWGEEPIPELKTVCVERDAFEFAVLRFASELKKPVFAICRGSQILNVFFGGTLYQDLKTQTDVKVKHSQTGEYTVGTHTIIVEKNSRFYHILRDRIFVNSFHHMAVKDLAKNFICTGKSVDGIVELFESTDKDKFIIGTQWHPEMMSATNTEMMLMFKEFIAACGGHKCCCNC
ncbi:MAG: gamma-glutamyl-gamma-aminobutyrate hydrolase [Treponema sp.]|nr:MAG: gamma-glutamyl-gamma-aminobutyrate hydrolase [Treponema sp.]